MGRVGVPFQFTPVNCWFREALLTMTRFLCCGRARITSLEIDDGSRDGEAGNGAQIALLGGGHPYEVARDRVREQMCIRDSHDPAGEDPF